ncbi:MAG: hypothetical protein JWO67_2914 [Streptosporangiaceae bacterium]|nr:hypothetical protein [Streptosporangiaceae bacterium]
MVMERENRAPGAWGRPDASMSLLADLFAGKVLDPGYAEAATRRAAPGVAASRPRRGARVAGLLIVLAVIGLLLAAAGEQVRRSEPVAARQRARLITEIRGRTAESDALQRRLAALRSDTERVREASLASSDAGRRARGRLARLSDAAAATPASGGALVVALQEAQGAGQETDGAGGGRVYDQDLQIVVNGLWSAGATAIAINGQRLTSLTAIRSAGEAILVDYRPLSPPYTVTALGDRELLRTGFAHSPASGHLRALKDQYGISADIHSERGATLPAAGALRLRYAQEETNG